MPGFCRCFLKRTKSRNGLGSLCPNPSPKSCCLLVWIALGCKAHLDWVQQLCQLVEGSWFTLRLHLKWEFSGRFRNNLSTSATRRTMAKSSMNMKPLREYKASWGRLASSIRTYLSKFQGSLHLSKCLHTAFSAFTRSLAGHLAAPAAWRKFKLTLWQTLHKILEFDKNPSKQQESLDSRFSPTNLLDI